MRKNRTSYFTAEPATQRPCSSAREGSNPAVVPFMRQPILQASKQNNKSIIHFAEGRLSDPVFSKSRAASCCLRAEDVGSASCRAVRGWGFGGRSRSSRWSLVCNVYYACNEYTWWRQVNLFPIVVGRVAGEDVPLIGTLPSE